MELNPDKGQRVMKECHLGDSVYAYFDGHHVILSAHTKKIYLDSRVLSELLGYMELAYGVKITIEKENKQEAPKSLHEWTQVLRGEEY